MSLSTIPTELKLIIAELLNPISCLNFALTDKENLRLLLSHVAQHKRFSERYNTISTGPAEIAGRLIWDIAKEILGDPRRAPYIHDISLPGDRQTCWEPGYSINDSSVPESDVQLYMDAVRNDAFLKKELEKTYYDPYIFGQGWTVENSIRVGDDEPIIAIILKLASNIRVLRFTDDAAETDDSTELYSTVKGIALAYGDPAPLILLPFQTLTNVAVSHYTSEGCCDSRWAKVFLAIPSLKGFAAHMMGGRLSAYGDDSDLQSLRPSNVKTILFQCSFFSPETVETLLKGTKALQTFIYENGGAIVSDEGCFAPRRIIQALTVYAGHSLEHLSLARDDGDYVYDYAFDEIAKVSLQGFQKLKTLRCSWSAIFHEDVDDSNEDEDVELPEGKFFTEESHERADLHTRFPRSLEVLHLEGIDDDEDDWIALVRIVREADTYLPNLRQIWVDKRLNSEDKIRKHERELSKLITDRRLQWMELPYSPNTLSELLVGQGYS